MKIILSRKGFDSSNAGIPSAIMPDGRLCWFPIPSSWNKVRYGDLRFEAFRMSDIISDLSKGRMSRSDRCHLDPDIFYSYLPRPRNWRPCFGQVGIAQAHLQGNGISPGDIFIFFGWFRRIEKTLRGHWRYVPMEPDLHVIFGWLQVDHVFNVDRDFSIIPNGCRNHAHVNDHSGHNDPPSNETIYVASKKLEFPGIPSSVPGGGAFPRYLRIQQLTAPGKSRTNWRLPLWAFPNSAKPPLSYHSDMTRWRKGRDGVFLRTVSRGQEFVMDLDFYPEAKNWVRSLFRSVDNPER